MDIHDHLLADATLLESPNADERPGAEISLIVVHGISLPAGHFGSRYVPDLFLNRLDAGAHPDFVDLAGVEVSSHLLIRRDATVLQFVPFHRRAWHAGVSAWLGRERCNDFSIGIELEGTDTSPYRDCQYRALARVCSALIAHYDLEPGNVCGHSDVAPGRKTDPGPSFDWRAFRNLMAASRIAV